MVGRKEDRLAEDEVFERKLDDLVEWAWAVVSDGRTFEYTLASRDQLRTFRRHLRRRATANGWQIETGVYSTRTAPGSIRLWARLPEWDERNPEEAARREREAVEKLATIRREQRRDQHR